MIELENENYSHNSLGRSPDCSPEPRKNARLKIDNLFVLSKSSSIFRAFMRGF